MDACILSLRPQMHPDLDGLYKTVAAPWDARSVLPPDIYYKYPEAVPTHRRHIFRFLS